MTVLLLPITFLKFWYVDAPLGIARYFLTLNRAFLHAVSVPLFLSTFFKPLKNEYRHGLVGFSIGMGIAVKSVWIIFHLILFLLLVSLELLIIIGFLFVPAGTVWLLFL